MESTYELDVGCTYKIVDDGKLLAIGLRNGATISIGAEDLANQRISLNESPVSGDGTPLPMRLESGISSFGL